MSFTNVSQPIERRQFLKAFAVAVIATGAAMAGASAIETKPPVKDKGPQLTPADK